MRLKEYLTEDFGKDVDLIEKNCKVYLGSTKGLKYLLLRDFESNRVFNKDLEVIKSRTDRRPKDTPMHIHEKINEMFRKKFGWDVRNGVFCEGEWCSFRKDNGFQRFIFPVDGFKFVWSPSVGDFFIDVYKYKIKNVSYKEPNIDEILNDYVKSCKNTNLKDAINSRNEISLLCKEYYAVSYQLLRNINYVLKMNWVLEN